MARLQAVADAYLAQRGKVEGVSGVALFVDPGAHGPAAEVFSGTDGLPDARPIGANTLFQIGSNTKHFTAALILKLEAEGKLDIDQTIGHWLPQYPAWAKVTIRSLLDMTSGIPNYSETVEIGQIMAADIHHQFTPAQLIAAVYPGDHLPRNSGWFYSNTNNILAALIIEAASGMSYKDALETLFFKPLQLHDTFYSDGPYPAAVLDRLPRGLYENHECLLYQPTPCDRSIAAPLIGHDMRTQNLSWAGAAGAIIGTPRDLTKWVRALFGGRVIPQKQLDEMTSIVSQKTGLPIRDVSAADPTGFGLDLGRAYHAEMGGAYWFYEGMTLGFRVIFAYWPQYDLVITAATNSQPPEGENQFGKLVVGGAFEALRAAGVLGAAR
ncbi:MAG: beta-lactamase family protein [Alphaproteobacteria bacterium]|nr:beta-lactamase family protein [Alphaproteobacteria bacterium]